MNLCKISSCQKSICRACFVIRAEKLFGFKNCGGVKSFLVDVYE